MDGDLSAVLSRFPAVARPSGEPEPLGNAGGLSGSRLWRFRSGLGTLLARAWPAGGPPRPALEAVHGWLAEAGGLGFVPVPVRGLDGRTLHERAGRLWEVAPWMPGAAATAPPSPVRVRAAFAALAAFHQRLAHRAHPGPSPGLQARARELAWLHGGGFDAIQGLLDRAPGDPLTGRALRWVEAARGEAPALAERLARASAVVVDRQPCLRDVRPEHVLFTGDAVTGLIDFGAMGVETVAADLARLMAEWLGRSPGLRGAALDAYAAVRPLTPAETSLIAPFERSTAVLGPAHWVRWHFVEGRAFDDPEAVARGLDKGLARIAAGNEPPGG